MAEFFDSLRVKVPFGRSSENDRTEGNRIGSDLCCAADRISRLKRNAGFETARLHSFPDERFGRFRRAAIDQELRRMAGEVLLALIVVEKFKRELIAIDRAAERISGWHLISGEPPSESLNKITVTAPVADRFGKFASEWETHRGAPSDSALPESDERRFVFVGGQKPGGRFRFQIIEIETVDGGWPIGLTGRGFHPAGRSLGRRWLLDTPRPGTRDR